MTLASFALKGILRSHRTAIPLLLLAALTAMTVTGALLAGSSVRETLSAIARERLGNASSILHTQKRYLSSALAGRHEHSKEEEFADVFAWLCTLANINDVDLEKAIEKYTIRGVEGTK